MSSIRLCEIRDTPLDVAEVVAALDDDASGGLTLFVGRVRDHDGGKGVSRLEYSGHPGAGEVIIEVAREITERYPDTVIALAHRVGPLAIGETARGCAVAAPHRKQAFAACDDLVDTVKQRLPIWKHQHFADGTDEWVGALG